MLTGSCHCGAVRLEVDEMPATLTDCNCSICRRYGTLWAYYTRRSARIVSPPGATSVYVWGPKSTEFHRCNTCGCVTHWTKAERERDDRIGVNARLLEPDAIASVRIRKLDGASTWKYLDEDGRASTQRKS